MVQVSGLTLCYFVSCEAPGRTQQQTISYYFLLSLLAFWHPCKQCDNNLPLAVWHLYLFCPTHTVVSHWTLKMASLHFDKLLHYLFHSSLCLTSQNTTSLKVLTLPNVILSQTESRVPDWLEREKKLCWVKYTYFSFLVSSVKCKTRGEKDAHSNSLSWRACYWDNSKGIYL